MCYLLIFHISLGVIAIVTLVKGTLQISHRFVATGTPAYMAGLILLLPFPLTLAVVFTLVSVIGAHGHLWHAMAGWEQGGSFHEIAFLFLTFGTTTACLALAFLIGMIWARDPAEVAAERRRLEEDWD